MALNVPQSTPAKPARTPAPEPLPLPKARLTPDEQLAALQRVQDQAEHRIRLGTQLFKAAEAYTSQHRQLFDQIKSEHETLREQMRDDIARSFRQYDQWIANMDEQLTNSLRQLEDRMAKLQDQWSHTQKRIDDMLRRSEALLDQSRDLLDLTLPEPGSDETPKVNVVIPSQQALLPRK